MLQFSSRVLWFPFFPAVWVICAASWAGCSDLVTEVNQQQDLLRISSLGSLQVRLAVLTQSHIAAGVDGNLGTPSDTSMGKWCLTGNLDEAQQRLCL